ncbi:MAG: carbamate kinase [Melioribacteraceae bacterium]|nr:MAG: carbamate kinase [Melioribacteraceae bacterium]
MREIAVVAFGGNALQKGNEGGSIEQQEQVVYETCENLLELIKKDVGLIITHGNGPQVGTILLQNEAGYELYKLPKKPIDVAVADSQGWIGYMIDRQLRNVLNDNGIKKDVVALVTQVLVDRNDPAFEKPTKPVGRFFVKEEADLLAKANGWQFVEDARKRGWRRVVPSPKPMEIENKDLVKSLAEQGYIVITCGGGGIPVFRHENNYLEAIEAVIDKDLASSLLAREIDATNFYILTDVEKAYINFNKPEQKALDAITPEEAKSYLENGEFGAGSMGPKVQAALSFTEESGHEAIITSSDQLKFENCGTRIRVK